MNTQESMPTLCFNGSDFSSFIAFVKSMNAKEKSKYARIALLHVENGRLVCRAIDEPNVVVEYCIDLFYCEKIISEQIAVSINDLAALIKCPSANDKFTIRYCNGQYEFNIVGDGWMPFKTVEVENDKFVITSDISEIGIVNSVKLRNAISCILGYTQDGIYARDKFIRFSNTKMVASCRQSSVTMADNFVDVTLHRDEATMLKSLLKDNFDLHVGKSNCDGIERLVFSGPKFKLSITASDIGDSDVDYIENIEDYLTVDCDELIKLVTCAEEYSVSRKVVGMMIKNGKLQVNVKNHLANQSVSTIRSTMVGNLADTCEESEIPTSHLLKTLKMFQDKHSREVSIYIADKMVSEQHNIVLFDNNTQAIINIHNR